MNTVVRKWHKWGKFLNAVRNEPATCASGTRSSRKTIEPHWYGTKSIDDALSLAETGWREKAKTLRNRGAELLAKVGRHLVTVEPCYNVAGAAIEMGRYTSGRPDCWIDFNPEVREGIGENIVRIAFNACVSGGMSTDSIERRGAAVVALVEALELSGRRVELEVIRSGTTGGNRMILGVVVKSPDQPYDADRLTFALCHPSMPRRLFFSVGESINREDADKLGWKNTAELILTPDNDIDHVDADIRLADNNTRYWDNPEEAEKGIIALLKAQGVELR